MSHRLIVYNLDNFNSSLVEPQLSPFAYVSCFHLLSPFLLSFGKFPRLYIHNYTLFNLEFRVAKDNLVTSMILNY